MKKVVAYEIWECSAEIPCRRRRDLDKIKPGFAFDNDSSPETLDGFYNAETAVEEFEKYDTKVEFFGSPHGLMARIVECVLVEVVYTLDEDGEPDEIISVDVVAYSAMPAEIGMDATTYVWNDEWQRWDERE